MSAKSRVTRLSLRSSASDTPCFPVCKRRCVWIGLVAGSPRSLSEDPRESRAFGCTLHVHLTLPPFSGSDSHSRDSGVAFEDCGLAGAEQLIYFQPYQIDGSLPN